MRPILILCLFGVKVFSLGKKNEGNYFNFQWMKAKIRGEKKSVFEGVEGDEGVRSTVNCL